jgi:glutamate carboxypeptidase
MKAGVAMALTAIEMLTEADLLKEIVLLLNSDEEVGSPVSRPITERLAASARGLCAGAGAGAGL